MGSTNLGAHDNKTLNFFVPDTMPSSSPDCVIESSVALWEVGVIISIRGRQTELQLGYLFPLHGGAGDSGVLCRTSASFRNTLYL